MSESGSNYAAAMTCITIGFGFSTISVVLASTFGAGTSTTALGLVPLITSLVADYKLRSRESRSSRPETGEQSV